MAPNGTDVRRLTRNVAIDSFAEWSPEGSRIVFSSDRRGTFDLYTIDPDGEQLARITAFDEDELTPT